MSKTDLDTVIGLLAKLTTEELAAVGQHVKSMKELSVSNKEIAVAEAATSGSDADILLDAITYELRHMGVEIIHSATLKSSKLYPAFAEKAPDVLKFLRKAISSDKQIGLLHLAVRLLYRDMKEMGVPVSSRLMLSHAHRIPSIINKQFPGYVQAGLLGLVFDYGFRDSLVRETTRRGRQTFGDVTREHPVDTGTRRRTRRGRVTDGDG